MKILTLSDLEWNIESKEISDVDLAKFPFKKDFSRIFFTDYLGVKFLDMSDGYGFKLKKILTKEMKNEYLIQGT